MNLLSSPQLLSAELELAAGMSQVVSLETMASRSYRWLLVDTMDVSIRCDASDNVQSGTPQNPFGSMLNFRAYAYNNMLNREYTPVWLMGPRLHLNGEAAQNQLTDITNFENYRWKFAKPFLLPPGGAFKVQFQRTARNGATDDGASWQIELSVRASQLSEVDARKYLEKNLGNPLPYITFFNPQIATPSKSSNLELANPFLSPYQIQRVVGRVSGQRTQYGSVYTTGANTQITDGYVKLTDTRTVICEPTPFLTLFSRPSLGWTFTRILEKDEYLTAELNVQGPATGTVLNPQVSLVGYRNEVMP